MKMGFLMILNMLIMLSIYKADATEYYVTCPISADLQSTLYHGRVKGIIDDIQKLPNIQDEITLDFAKDFKYIILADVGIDLKKEELEKAKEALQRIASSVPEVILRDRLYVNLNLISSADYGYLVMEIVDQSLDKLNDRKLNLLAEKIKSELGIPNKGRPYVIIASYKLSDVKKLEAISKYYNEYNKTNSSIAIFLNMNDDQKVINEFTLNSYSQGWFFGSENIVSTYKLKSEQDIKKEELLIAQCRDLSDQVDRLATLVK